VTIRHVRYIREILDHPFNRERKLAAFWRYVRWNIGRRLLNEAEYSIDLVEGCSAVLSNGENYATLAYTCHLYDFDDMLFLLHFLKRGDGFGDFGANVGIYSLLAGTRGARVIAVEPVDDTYARLCRNLRLNDLQAVTLKVGLGSEASTARFTTTMGGMNRVARGGDSDTAEVQITTVDDVVARAGFAPRLVKIDVEGYEYPLLQGADRLLSSGHLSALVVELNGSGKVYGFSDAAVHELLERKGFVAFRYDPFERALIETGHLNESSFNTLYIRKEQRDVVARAVKEAAPVRTPIGLI
jgi:FkbM family methyltransferase